MGLISKQMVFEAIGMCDITQGNKVDGKREEGLWPTPGTLQHFKVGQKKLGRKQRLLCHPSQKKKMLQEGRSGQLLRLQPKTKQNKTKQNKTKQNKTQLDFTSWRLWWTLKIVTVVEIMFLSDCVKERKLWTLDCGELIDNATNTHTLVNRPDKGQI